MPAVLLLAATLAVAPAGGGSLPDLAPEPPPTLRAGFAMVEITPPLGMRRANSYYEQFAREVHDPLHVRGAYFDDGAGGKACLLLCDLTSLSSEVADRVRAEVGRTLGVPDAAVVVAATHTHGAVLYDGPFRELFHERAMEAEGKDAAEPIDFPRFLADRCLQAAREAAATASPVTLFATETVVPDLTFNRRFFMEDGSVRFNPGYQNPNVVRPAGPVDDTLTALWLEPLNDDADEGSDGGADGGAGGCLTSWPMHTAVFTRNRLGADFPGVMHTALRAEYGDGFGFVHGQGTSGNTNHIDVSKPGLGMDSADYSRIVGERLAAALIAARPSAEPAPAAPVVAAKRVVPLTLRAVTEADAARADDRLARLGSKETPPFLELVDAYSVRLRQTLGERYGDAMPAEVRVVRLGENAAVVALPYEVFVEIGLDIKARSPFPHTLIVTLAGSVDAYVPDRRAYPQGAYEVVNTPFAPGAGEALGDAAVALLTSLHSASQQPTGAAGDE